METVTFNHFSDVSWPDLFCDVNNVSISIIMYQHLEFVGFTGKWASRQDIALIQVFLLA